MVIVACSLTRYRSTDPFYASYDEWDLIRFPLIKPYEAVRLTGNDWWGVSIPYIPNTPSLLYSGGVPFVQEIAVANEVIMVHTPYEPRVSENLRDRVFYWFAFIPATDIQRGFQDEGDFRLFIEEYGISEVAWESPDTLFQRFKDTGCLEWIPGCQ